MWPMVPTLQCSRSSPAATLLATWAKQRQCLRPSTGLFCVLMLGKRNTWHWEEEVALVRSLRPKTLCREKILPATEAMLVSSTSGCVSPRNLCLPFEISRHAEPARKLAITIDIIYVYAITQWEVDTCIYGFPREQNHTADFRFLWNKAYEQALKQKIAIR